MADDGEIMRDEQAREAELALDVLEEVDDLRLDRDIEGRHRLVEDEHLGLERERPGNADPLPLPARELVWVSASVGGVEPDMLDEFVDTPAAGRAAPEAVHPERLVDEVVHRHPRIEREVRILEDDLQPAPEPPHSPPVVVGDVLAAKQDPPGRRLQEAQDQACRCRLAAA